MNSGVQAGSSWLHAPLYFDLPHGFLAIIILKEEVEFDILNTEMSEYACALGILQALSTWSEVPSVSRPIM